MPSAFRLRCWARWLGPLGLGILAALTTVGALAAVTIPTPPGWSRTVSQPTRQRVDAWATAAGGRTTAVMTTRGDDEYDEILAVIGMAGVLPATALADTPEAEAPRDAALAYAAQALWGVDGPPDRSGRTGLGADDLAVLHARWTVDGEALLLALVPTGRNHSAVVMALEADSRVLYESAFDDLLDQVQGAAPPLRPFPRQRWLLAAAFGWVLLGAATTLIVARIGLRLHPRAVAVRAALVLTLAGAVVGGIVYSMLDDRTVDLSLAGLSPAWMAMQIAGIAFGLAIALFIGGTIWDRRRVPVSSAPTGGSFAPRPLSSSTNVRAQPPPSIGAESQNPPAPHVDLRETPIVGEPIVPPPAAAEMRPVAAAGTMGDPEPKVTVRHGTGEQPANLELATELPMPADPGRAVPADAPGPLRVQPSGAQPETPPPPPPPPAVASGAPGVPQALAADQDVSGPASLETEQILVARDRGRAGVGARRIEPPKAGDEAE